MTRLLELTPDSDSYSVEFSDGVIHNILDGGRGRYRKDVLNSSDVISVMWKCSRNEYDYIRAFHRWASENAGTPFEMDLVVDQHVLTRHLCNFVPNTFRLQEQRGHAYVAVATLEVRPLIYDSETNQALIDLFEAFGDSWPEMVDKIDYVINWSIPSYLGA